jgi:phage antirepressor YoqD-like protein
MMNAIQNATSTQLSMTSREISELTGKTHGDILRDIRNMLDALEKDQSSFADIYSDSYGRTQRAFKLPYDETVCLLTGYDAKARMAVIKRWRELEAGAAVALPDFANPAAAARAWADAVEAKQALQVELEAAKPAIEFVDKYVRTDDGKGFREVCKLLGAKEPRFRDFLRDEKIMYFLNGDWAPYAQHLDAGRFVVKAGAANGHAFSRTLFTSKGVNWIAGEWAKHQLRSHVSFANRAPAAEVRA